MATQNASAAHPVVVRVGAQFRQHTDEVRDMHRYWMRHRGGGANETHFPLSQDPEHDRMVVLYANRSVATLVDAFRHAFAELRDAFHLPHLALTQPVSVARSDGPPLAVWPMSLRIALWFCTKYDFTASFPRDVDVLQDAMTWLSLRRMLACHGGTVDASLSPALSGRWAMAIADTPIAFTDDDVFHVHRCLSDHVNGFLVALDDALRPVAPLSHGKTTRRRPNA